jgi:hypothetical protein
MAVALHTYILDEQDNVVARLTFYGGTEEEATDHADELFDGEWDGWDIEVLEEHVSAPEAEEMRTTEKAQGRVESDDDEEPPEEGDGEEEEEEEEAE